MSGKGKMMDASQKNFSLYLQREIEIDVSMDKKQYMEEEKQNSAVAESSLTFGTAVDANRRGVTKSSVLDFKTQWERSLSLDEFRDNCLVKLKRMYGECSD